MEDDNVAVIELSRFTEESLAAWIEVWDNIIDEVVEANPSKLILDLRGDTGGYFDAAVWAAGEFLPEGTVVAYQQDRDLNKVEFTVKILLKRKSWP
jgi:C-terminal processing protease CtpA/Prc